MEISTRKRPAADVISSLPDDILINVISSLPIRNLVATSALSKRWSYLWALSPSLDLRCNLHNKTHCISSAAAASILNRHSAPFLTTCHLSLHPVNCWANNNDNHENYLLLLDHIASKSVQTLTLTGCYHCHKNHVFPEPPDLPLLANLRRLSLINVHDWNARALDEFLEVVCCKVETLRLWGLPKVHSINIGESERLKELEIGDMNTVFYVRVIAPELQSLTVDLSSECTTLTVRAPSLRVLKAKFGSSSCIRCEQLMGLSCGLYEASTYYVPKKPELQVSSFLTLNKLSISLNLDDIRQAHVLAYALNKCMLLQELDLTDGYEVISNSDHKCLPYPASNFWQRRKMSGSSCIYSQLHHIKIRKLRAGTLEVEFVTFMISKSRRLKSLGIWPDFGVKGLEDLLLVEPASAALVVTLHSEE